MKRFICALMGVLAVALCAAPSLSADKTPLANYGGSALPIKTTDNAAVQALKLLGVTGSTQCLQADTTGLVSGDGNPCGTVTSVGLSLPAIFTVTGSPVTTSGTLTGTLASQSQNLVFASPNGSSGAPSFRALVGADLPNPSASTLGGIESYAAVSHQWINAISTAGVPSSTQPAFSDVSGTATVAQGGTGQTTYTDGQLLIGDSSTNGLDKATLTAGANVTITNGHGTITIAATGGGGTGTVTSVATSGGITGGTITTTGTVSLIGVDHPGGRLTLVTGTPVMTSDQTAKSTVYYDCAPSQGGGNRVPYYDGSNDQVEAISSCEVSLTMQTSGTGVTNNAGIFDVWWVHSGASRICVATNGSGGGWASDTGGSNTARGTGYSQLHNTRGYYTNVNAISHCYNGTTDYGSVSADQATYLGTLYTTAAGQTGMAYNPTAASGGTGNILGLFNAYNQVSVRAISHDKTSGFTISSATWATLHTSTSNRISYVDGLAVTTPKTGLGLSTFASGSNQGEFGINFNATTGQPDVAQQSSSTAAFTIGTVFIADRFAPSFGLNFVQAMQQNVQGSGTITVSGDNAGLGPALTLDVEM